MISTSLLADKKLGIKTASEGKNVRTPLDRLNLQVDCL
jgi:hypothetical protein